MDLIQPNNFHKGLLKLMEEELERQNITVTDRPGWQEYFMLQAEEVALRSTCYNRKVGAIIVKDKRSVATGYNGAPAGINSCFQDHQCTRKYREVDTDPIPDELAIKHAQASIEREFDESSGGPPPPPTTLQIELAREELRGIYDTNGAYAQAVNEISKSLNQRFCRATHAEINAITQAARQGISIAGADMYVTLEPCENCTRTIIATQLKHVYFARFYRDSSKFNRDLTESITSDRGESTTAFVPMEVSEKTRLLVSYEALRGDVSRNRSR